MNEPSTRVINLCPPQILNFIKTPAVNNRKFVSITANILSVHKKPLSYNTNITTHIYV